MLKQRKELLGEDGQDLELTPRQMLLRIIDIVSGEGMTGEKLERVLRAVEAIAAEDRQKV